MNITFGVGNDGVVIQSLGQVRFSATPWTVAHQAPLSFTTSWSLLKLTFIESEILSNHLLLCSPLFPLPWIFPSPGSFPVSQLLASGGQSTGASASTSVLPVSIQGWFHLGLTGLISLQSRDSQESSPAPQFESISSSALILLYCLTLTSMHDSWKNHSFDYRDLCWQSDCFCFLICCLGLS